MAMYVDTCDGLFYVHNGKTKIIAVRSAKSFGHNVITDEPGTGTKP